MAEPEAPVADDLQPAGFASSDVADSTPSLPLGGLSLRLVQAVDAVGGDTLVLAQSEARAEEIGRALRVFAPEREVAVMPAWDCLPYDRASPPHEMMGRRMATLAWAAADFPAAQILVTSPEALIQRLPPRTAATETRLTFRPGETLDREAFGAWTARVGYVAHERVNEPGEWLMLGEVVDIFSPSLAHPVRLRLDADDRIIELDLFDPLTQRTTGALHTMEIGAASELVGDNLVREAGEEHRLPRPMRRSRRCSACCRVRGFTPSAARRTGPGPSWGRWRMPATPSSTSRSPARPRRWPRRPSTCPRTSWSWGSPEPPFGSTPPN